MKLMSVCERLRSLLTAGLSIQHLQVSDESHAHGRGHSLESHFKVVLVSPDFTGLSRVQRHRCVYALLEAPLQEGVHALALHLFSPQEWQESQGLPDSPVCRGGSRQTADES